MHHFQSSSQQHSKLDVIFIIPPIRTLRLGPIKLTAQGCSLTSGPSPGSHHCPRSWAHRGGYRGGVRTDVVLRGHSWPVLFLSRSVQGRLGLWDSPCSSTHHPVPSRHTQFRKALPSPCHSQPLLFLRSQERVPSCSFHLLGHLPWLPTT